MAKPWSEVEKSEAYISLSPDEQLAAKKEYWGSVITQKDQFKSLNPRQQDAAYIEFTGLKPQTEAPIQSIGGMLKKNLIQAGKDTYREGVSPVLSGISTLAFGIPKAIASKTGARDIIYPEQKTAEGKTLRFLSEITGFMKGGAVKAGSKIASKVTGDTVRRKVAREAVKYGSAGFIQTPEQQPFSIGQRAFQGGVGATAAAVSTLLSSLPKLVNLGGRKTSQAIAEKADKGIDKISQTLSDKYDDTLKAIKGKVKTESVIKDIQNTIDEFPEGASVGKLKSIIKRLGSKPEIGVDELFNIKKEIGKTIPKSVWNGASEADAMVNSREQLYWRLTEQLEGVGGEKFKGLTKEYKNFKQAERLARKMFYRQGIPSNAPLTRTYDVPTERAVGDLNRQLPPKEQFAQQFEAWRRGQMLKRGVRRAVRYIAPPSAVGYGVYRSLKGGD